LHNSQANLLQIARATRAPGVFPRPAENGKEDRREEAYNGNDD
jgi:hypothetical protein